MVAVADDRGKPLGTALYSSASQIAIRMISLAGGSRFSRPDSRANCCCHDLPGRVVSDSDAYRLVFSEADFLPGLIVDRYHDLLSLQILTQAMDNETARAAY